MQQKISGSFRSAEGARNHAALRTVLDTARKQGRNLLETLRTSPEELVARLATRHPAQAGRAARPGGKPPGWNLNSYSRSRIPVIHWSWMHVLTTADLLIGQQSIASHDQLVLLNEFRRFLAHESAGVRGFDRMPREWTELNRLVSAGGDVSANSHEAIKVMGITY